MILRRAHGNVKVAIVMQKTGLPYAKAVSHLRRADGLVRDAVGEDIEQRLRDLLGASADRDFPVTTYTAPSGTFVWRLPPNSGFTMWLKASVFGTAAVAAEDSIRRIRVTWDDCHVVPAAGTRAARLPSRNG